MLSQQMYHVVFACRDGVYSSPEVDFSSAVKNITNTG